MRYIILCLICFTFLGCSFSKKHDEAIKELMKNCNGTVSAELNINAILPTFVLKCSECKKE